VCPVLVGIGACAMLCNNNTDLQLKAWRNYVDEKCISTLCVLGGSSKLYSGWPTNLQLFCLRSPSTACWPEKGIILVVFGKHENIYTYFQCFFEVVGVGGGTGALVCRTDTNDILISDCWHYLDWQSNESPRAFLWSVLTLCRPYLKPYCMGRKAAFFFFDGLDGPGIESRWGRDFSHTSRPALGPTQPPV
jgi:hypothetical protein